MREQRKDSPLHNYSEELKLLFRLRFQASKRKNHTQQINDSIVVRYNNFKCNDGKVIQTKHKIESSEIEWVKSHSGKKAHTSESISSEIDSIVVVRAPFKENGKLQQIHRSSNLESLEPSRCLLLLLTSSFCLADFILFYFNWCH